LVFLSKYVLSSAKQYKLVSFNLFRCSVITSHESEYIECGFYIKIFSVDIVEVEVLPALPSVDFRVHIFI